MSIQLGSAEAAREFLVKSHYALMMLDLRLPGRTA